MPQKICRSVCNAPFKIIGEHIICIICSRYGCFIITQLCTGAVTSLNAVEITFIIDAKRLITFCLSYKYAPFLLPREAITHRNIPSVRACQRYRSSSAVKMSKNRCPFALLSRLGRASIQISFNEYEANRVTTIGTLLTGAGRRCSPSRPLSSSSGSSSFGA